MTNPAVPYRLRVPHDVAGLIRGLHPRLQHKIKGGLRTMQRGPRSGKPLREELAGLRSHRVSRFRIIYRVADETTIELVAAGPRKNIYEETFHLPHRLFVEELSGQRAP